MPEKGFFYNTGFLAQIFKILSGKVKFEIDDRGIMLVKSAGEVYMQLPVVANTVKTAKAKPKVKKEEAA
jgi:hypothetical protein